MRRREKFVIVSLVLSGLLLAVQYMPLEWRWVAIIMFGILSYGLATWALAEDLLQHERLTIVPFPALYAVAVAWFYFLLPAGIISRGIIIGLFAVGMYALLLTANIYSVAKGRTIQLLYAAQTISLFFTLLTSVLFSSTILSVHLAPWFTGSLVAAAHFPLVLMSLWSVRLDEHWDRQLVLISGVTAFVLGNLAMALSFIPFSSWFVALFVMSLLYIALGVLQSYLRERLFERTIREYALVSMFVVILFIVSFPWK